MLACEKRPPSSRLEEGVLEEGFCQPASVILESENERVIYLRALIRCFLLHIGQGTAAGGDVG